MVEKHVPAFGVYAIVEDTAWGLLIRRQTVTDPEPVWAYFWLSAEDGLLPTDSVRLVAGTRCRPISDTALVRRIMLELRDFAVGVQHDGNIDRPPTQRYANFSDDIGYFLAGKHEIGKFFGSPGRFKGCVLDKKWGQDRLVGYAKFGVRDAHDVLGVYSPGNLFAPIFSAHRTFGGRHAELEDLNRFVLGESPGYYFVTAPDGFGKTALLANWLNTPGVYRCEMAVHFLSRRFQTQSEYCCLSNTCQQLALVHGMSGSTPHELLKLRALFASLLKRTPPAGRRVLLVIDGLDEAMPDWDPTESLFPRPLPDGVQVVFSARQTADRDWLTHLGLRAGQDCDVLQLGRLTLEGVRDVVKASHLANAQMQDQLSKRLFNVTDGDPFYIAEIVARLGDNALSPDEIDRLPVGHIGYLRQWWREACRTYAGRAFEELMAFLALARAPLGRDAILLLSQNGELSGLRFQQVLDSVARYIEGDKQSGYQLRHPRIAEFIRKEMGQDLRSYLAAFVALCERWREHDLPERVRDYVYRYAVDHLAEVGDKRKLVAFVDRDWVNAKRSHFGYDAAVQADLKTCYGILSSEEPSLEALGHLFKLGLCRKDLERESFNKALALAESVYRVRCGEIERGVAESEYSGSQDARLLVLIELLCSRKPQLGASGKRLIQEALELAPSCSAWVIEWAAIRMCDVNGAWAIMMAQKVPVPEFPTTWDFDEKPNRMRCLFRIFKTLTAKGESRRKTLCESLENKVDRVNALLGMASELATTDITESRELINQATSQISSDAARGLLRDVVIRYMYWQCDRSRPEHRLIALAAFLNDSNPLNAPGFSLDALDPLLRDANSDLEELVSSLPNGSMRELLLLRQEAIGAKHSVTHERFEAPVIRDLANVATWISDGKLDRESGLELVDDLDSRQGYVAAVRTIATKLSANDVSLADAIVDAAFKSVEQEHNWTGFLLALTLVGAVIDRPGLLRARMLSWLCTRCRELEPRYARHDAKRLLGTCVSLAFASTEQSRTGSLASLLSDLRMEPNRAMVLQQLVEWGPLELCLEVLDKDGSEVALVVRDEPSGPGLLPESCIPVLCAIAIRAGRDDRRRALRAVHWAAALFVGMPPNLQDRFANQLVLCAATISPRYALALAKLLGIQGAALIDRLFTVVDSINRPSRVQETWLRAAVDFAVRESDPKEPGSRKPALAFREMSGAPFLGWIQAPLPPLTDKWWREMIDVCRSVGSSAAESLGRLMSASAASKWEECMSLLRELPLYQLSWACSSEEFTQSLLGIERNPQAMLEDILTLQHELSRCRTSESRKCPEFLNVVLAEAAVHDPTVCLDLMESVPKSRRIEFVDKLLEKRPKGHWSSKQAVALLAMVNCTAPDSWVRCVRLLCWLGRVAPISVHVVRRATSEHVADVPLPTVLSVILSLAEVFPREAVTLLDYAGNRAKDERDALSYLECARIGKAQARLSNESDSTRGADSCNIQKENSIRLKQAVSLLAVSRPLAGQDAEKAVDALAATAVLDRSTDIRRWSKVVDGLGISEEAQRRFACKLTERLIESRKIHSLGTCTVWLDAESRARLLVKLMATCASRHRSTVKRELKQVLTELPDGQARASILKAWGDSHLPHDSVRAFDLFEQSWKQLLMHGNELALALRSDDLACICIRVPGAPARQFIEKIWMRLQEYDFVDPVADARDPTLLSLTAAAWVNGTCVEPILGAVADAKEGRSAPLTLCGPLVRRGFETIAECQGIDRAMAYYDFLSCRLTPTYRGLLADAVVESFKYGSDMRSLAQFGNCEQVPTESGFELLRSVLGDCTPRTAPRGHLLVSLAHARSDPDKARKSLQLALDSIGAPEAASRDSSIRSTVRSLRALLLGERGCRDALVDFGGERDSTWLDLSGILASAMESSPDPPGLLRSVWSVAATHDW